MSIAPVLFSDTNVTDTIGQRIQDIREHLGSARKELSYQGLADEIAEKTGVSVSVPALRNYAEGTREPPIRVIEAIAAVDPLGRGKVWLTYGDDLGDAGTPTTLSGGAVGQSDGPIPDERMPEAKTDRKGRLTG